MTHDETLARRRRVAALVRDMAQGKLTSNQLHDQIRDLDSAGDAELGELLGLLRAAPTGAWFFGVDLAQCRQNPGKRIGELVERFLRDDAPSPAPPAR